MFWALIYFTKLAILYHDVIKPELSLSGVEHSVLLKRGDRWLSLYWIKVPFDHLRKTLSGAIFTRLKEQTQFLRIIARNIRAAIAHNKIRLRWRSKSNRAPHQQYYCFPPLYTVFSHLLQRRLGATVGICIAVPRTPTICPSKSYGIRHSWDILSETLPSTSHAERWSLYGICFCFQEVSPRQREDFIMALKNKIHNSMSENMFCRHLHLQQGVNVNRSLTFRLFLQPDHVRREASWPYSL